jgi:sugar phosphate isomerase/epimerase
MKIGFSTSACPGWDLPTVVEKAKALGFAGVEIHGLGGDAYLPGVRELAGEPEAVRGRFAEAGVELVALASEASFHWPDTRILLGHEQRVREYVELAARLGCAYVTVSAGEVPPKTHYMKVLARVARALTELTQFAADHGVQLAVVNSPQLASSRDVWFLLEAVGSPAIRACWDARTAMLVRERPTTSVPRLNRKLGLVHVGDARFSSNGRPAEDVLPGEGDIGWERCVDLLRGVGYDGWLIFDCPNPCPPPLEDPQRTLPAVLAFLRTQIERKAAPQEKKPVVAAADK